MDHLPSTEVLRYIRTYRPSGAKEKPDKDAGRIYFHPVEWPGLLIRPITPADFETLRELTYAPLIKERDTIYLVLAQDHGSFSFLASEGDGEDLLGVLLALGSSDGSAVFVVTLWVVPEKRGAGAGGALVERLESTARQAGVRRIWLLSTVEAVGFYENRGYEQRLDFLDPATARYVRQVKRTPVFVKELLP